MWFNEFITTTLSAVHEANDVRYATRRTVGIHPLASTLFSGSTTAGELRGRTSRCTGGHVRKWGPADLVPMTKLYDLVPYQIGGYSSAFSLQYVLTRGK